MLGGLVARTEARAFVSEAAKHLAQMRRTKEFPYPGEGRVKFYVLTRGGVFAVEAGMEEVVRRSHRLMPLYYAADQVLTRLRLASEKPGP